MREQIAISKRLTFYSLLAAALTLTPVAANTLVPASASPISYSDTDELDSLQDVEGTINSPYQVVEADPAQLYMRKPLLPDLSGFTPQAAMARIQKATVGHAVIKRMLGEDALDEFIGGNDRLKEWVERQRQMPQAIFIENGYMTPQSLARELKSDAFREVSPGIFLARLPIVVRPGATFHVDEKTRALRLSQERGSFLVNDGALFITDTQVIAWRESENQPAKFRDKNEFRPYLISWGGTETYIINSTIKSFGYAASKAYGVSISQYSPSMATKMQRERPTGWLLNSTFEDHWYGFYCYEADDVVIRGNTYKNNLVYGIDPHDRSERLIIAENIAYGTKKKHGIIVSREVNDSWIFNNKSYENHLSGIVIDRSSSNNLVAYNESYRNGSDGITIYESPNNLLWGNHTVANQRHGIRLRNSTNIRMYENESVANGLLGVYGHIKDLRGTDRDIELDPFDEKVSMLLVGGSLVSNGSGPVSIASPLSVELYNIDFLAPSKGSGVSLSGVLGELQPELMNILFKRKRAALIEPVEMPVTATDL
ncbi:MAG: right-handed parallel beta-helix repeat-containing protein [Hahellaceae bacterium]|nr:right-handed parallel beta-helix repeat-containing protein [Hahellaceae bacterium]MCP5168319.1 right-handed parallel beta-helix repeat-containing protein [Hahellaceae bacterium]